MRGHGGVVEIGDVIGNVEEVARGRGAHVISDIDWNFTIGVR